MARVTLTEAATQLGYARGTLHAYLHRRPGAPSPVGRRGNARIYDLAELEAWLAPTTQQLANRRSTIAADTITCLECGRTLRSLGGHLRVHGLTAAEYRERHQLPRTAALESLPSRQRRADSTSREVARQLTHDPDAQVRRARVGREHTRVAHQSPIVAEHRAAGQAKGVEAMRRARRAALEARMREAGYDSLEHAVRATASMTVAGAAARLGCSVTSIRRWRVQHLGKREWRPAPPLEGETGRQCGGV